MSPEEYQREMEEAERLIREINSIVDRINRLNRENAELEVELDTSIQNVRILADNCDRMGNAVYKDMGYLSGIVGDADISTSAVHNALSELTTQYFTFKSISTASKNLSQYTDEYYTKFSNYNELRRIALGYIIGVDSNIVDSKAMRKKVEKIYLQNTDYWLAYCIAAVMLWVSDEKEAAQRALNKSLSMNYFNSSLFYLLVNLRFNRIDAAKQWYVNYLDRADQSNLGDEWQYLFQAYLFGAFGSDEGFQAVIAECFRNMLAQVEVTNVDFAKKFTEKALSFAELYLHKTMKEYPLLKSHCKEYGEMMGLLSTAEKNAEIAKYFDRLSEENIEAEELPQRIENILYSLINDYDEEELKVVKKMKYNEAIINARGDVAAAQKSYNAAFEYENKKKNFGDLLMFWAFADETAQVDASVRRFSISFMKEAIQKGLDKFVEKYRTLEKEKYSFEIDGYTVVCSEDEAEPACKALAQNYEKNRNKDKFKDKQVLIYSGVCALAVIILLLLIPAFSPAMLCIGILTGIAGSFLLWRRLVDLNAILRQKQKEGVELLKRTLEELKLWRADYKSEDEKSSDLHNSLNGF